MKEILIGIVIGIIFGLLILFTMANEEKLIKDNCSQLQGYSYGQCQASIY